jgi:hypothetical protein
MIRESYCKTQLSGSEIPNRLNWKVEKVKNEKVKNKKQPRMLGSDRYLYAQGKEARVLQHGDVGFRGCNPVTLPPVKGWTLEQI